MSLIRWTDEHMTGIREIDEQHRQLVDIVNKFDEAMRKGRGPRIMNGILNELIGYTQEHFAAEERWMAEARYRGLKKHQAKHRRLLQKVERFQFEFNGEGGLAVADVRAFLADWLTSHILEDDLKYVSALRPEKIET